MCPYQVDCSFNCYFVSMLQISDLPDAEHTFISTLPYHAFCIFLQHHYPFAAVAFDRDALQDDPVIVLTQCVIHHPRIAFSAMQLHCTPILLQIQFNSSTIQNCYYQHATFVLAREREINLRKPITRAGSSDAPCPDAPTLLILKPVDHGKP